MPRVGVVSGGGDADVEQLQLDAFGVTAGDGPQ